ncbi:RDD family protein [Maribellus sp. CM-23]|uniref:RDD family protein n=1 Tax=Maribellus sp. CM-23 TaxID=2781026 RepID=UPI001F2B865B|nr:RDD family protein [Maribellus sp. CM-23]MCE4562756.1 RDD family protein [Maribellus sp. CM-23]
MHNKMIASNSAQKEVSVESTSETVDLNSRFLRISSMLLDHLIMIIVIVPPLIILMILVSNDTLKMPEEISLMLFFSLIFIYLNKDFIRGKSLAKRIVGYQVISRQTEKPASELQCFVRNLTITVAWPLEVLIGFINPQRRIGDFLANTKVVRTEREKINSILTDIKGIKPRWSFVFIVLIGVFYFYLLSLTLPGIR